MAVAVYSVLLAAGVMAAGNALGVYTAPPTGVVVVRDIVLAATGGAGGQAVVEVLSGTDITIIKGVVVAATPVSEHWEGRQVVLPGDVLVVAAPNVAISYRISGYLLGG